MTTGQTLKLHQAVARSLADNGIGTMFGLMGDANMFMADSFIRECGGTFVAAAHEVGAALMALGFAQTSGQIGVCSVTQGPGLTNTVTALVEGVKGSVSMLLLCGDTATEDREHNQNVHQREFVLAAGAGFESLRSPRTVAQDVARALRRALVERRPIVLDLPIDFDWQDVDYHPVKVKLPESRATVMVSDDLDNAIGIIAAAKRPMILAGRGAASAEAKRAILALARRLEAPVATTLKGKDLFRGESFNLGICGTVSTAQAVEVILECDCLIAFGASLNRYTTSNGTFLKGKRIVQINLEPGEIGKNVPPDAGLVGDPAAVADLIVHWLNEAEIPPSGFVTPEFEATLARAATPPGRGGALDFRSALRTLDRLLPHDRVLVTDGGRFMVKTWTDIATDGPEYFLSTVNFSSIGLGMSQAIGAAFAHRGRPVVMVAGDGGFMLGGLAEFNTAVRYGLDMIVVICNDGAYGAEHIKFRQKDRDPAHILFAWPEFSQVAESLGGSGIVIRSEEDFPQIEAALACRKGPLLIDLKLDPDRISDE